MMKRCFNFDLLHRQRAEMQRRLFSDEWTVEEYYEAMHRTKPPYGPCLNCDGGSHDLPYDGIPDPRKDAQK